MIKQKDVNELFLYDSKTGIFTRKVKIGKFDVGEIAGSKCKGGYISICINYKQYYVHRLAWLVTYGEWPTFIDHINGIRDDNRIENLRECTRSQNMINRARNSKKLKGAFLIKISGRWMASIQKDGIQMHIGYFSTERQAHDAYTKRAKELFGEFQTERTMPPAGAN